MLLRSALGLVLVLLTACASGSGPAAARTSADPNVITQAELAPYVDRTAAQAIQRLRPQFLRQRGPSSINMRAGDVIVVYLGTTKLGGPEALQQVRAADLSEIRYLTPAEASQRYGLNHTSGAILLQPRS